MTLFPIGVECCFLLYGDILFVFLSHVQLESPKVFCGLENFTISILRITIFKTTTASSTAGIDLVHIDDTLLGFIILLF